MGMLPIIGAVFTHNTVTVKHFQIDVYKCIEKKQKWQNKSYSIQKDMAGKTVLKCMGDEGSGKKYEREE